MIHSELPGMWEESDLSGGEAEAEEQAAELARDRRLPVRAADAAQYARPAIPQADRGRIRVRLLNATPDPLGSVAALIAQYSGVVIRDLSEVTDDMRKQALDDMSKTVLNGPLEAVQFHFQIEGITRSITHQMVRARASFFAQESLRFAVPEGDWAEEIPLPPSLAGAREERRKIMESLGWERGHEPRNYSENLMALDAWEDAMINAQNCYRRLIELGMPAEEARGVLPHDMPTRIHMVCDLRQLLAEAGKRTCTQAQFPWRMIFAGIANELRRWGFGERRGTKLSPDAWQFQEIANRIRPVCYQTGSCGFMAQFDRSCTIRPRVDEFASKGIPSSEWSKGHEESWCTADSDCESADCSMRTTQITIHPINDAEWALNPAAARS